MGRNDRPARPGGAGLVVRGRPIDPALPTVLGAACISSSAIVARLADTPAVTTSFYRCALALPGLAVLAILEGRRRAPRRPAARASAVLAGALLGVDLVLWTHAIYDIGAGIATVVANLQVLFVTAFAWVLQRERPQGGFLAALPVVLVGVVLLPGVVGTAPRGSDPAAGLAFGFGASAAYAAFILVFRSATRGTPHVAGPLAEATVGAALAALVLGLVLGGMRFSVPGPSLFWLVVLALSSQTVGWLLITSSLPLLPAAVSSVLLLLQPAASVVLAAVVLSQRPTLLQGVGATLVCAGVAVAARARAGPEVALDGPTPG